VGMDHLLSKELFTEQMNRLLLGSCLTHSLVFREYG
jgi:hypothetical protein